MQVLGTCIPLGHREGGSLGSGALPPWPHSRCVITATASGDPTHGTQVNWVNGMDIQRVKDRNEKPWATIKGLWPGITPIVFFISLILGFIVFLVFLGHALARLWAVLGPALCSFLDPGPCVTTCTTFVLSPSFFWKNRKINIWMNETTLWKDVVGS